MENESEISQVECRQMVETLWRSFLKFAAEGSMEMGKVCIERFDERMYAEAAKMSEQKSARYLAMIDEERGAILDEYTNDPEGLKARLGVGQGQPSLRMPQHNTGNVVVTTAIRATVWESVRAIFRMFR